MNYRDIRDYISACANNHGTQRHNSDHFGAIQMDEVALYLNEAKISIDKKLSVTLYGG